MYKYRYWDAAKQEQAISTEYFTMEAIRDGLGTVIMESGTKVRSHMIDTNGRLKADQPRTEKES